MARDHDDICIVGEAKGIRRAYSVLLPQRAQTLARRNQLPLSSPFILFYYFNLGDLGSSRSLRVWK